MNDYHQCCQMGNLSPIFFLIEEILMSVGKKLLKISPMKIGNLKVLEVRWV